jgi:hypothetical protein
LNYPALLYIYNKDLSSLNSYSSLNKLF